MNRLVQSMGRIGRGMAGVAGAREALGETAAALPEKADEGGETGEKKEGKAAGGKKKKKGRK